MGLLAAAAEAAPDALLLSRRLAAATVLETRRRWPVFYPPIEVTERAAAIKALAGFADMAPAGPVKIWISSLLETLTNAWLNAEVQVTRQGAMGTGAYGLAALAGNFVRGVHGVDARLELWSAGSDVEWAAALGAAVCPKGAQGYSEDRGVDLIASLLSLDGRERVVTTTPETFVALEDLLAVDSDVPLVPFAKELASDDINRLRACVQGLASWNLDRDYMGDAVDKFNAEVRRYERRTDRLRSLNVVGFVASAALAGASAASPSFRQAIGPFASLGPAMASGLFLLVREQLASASPKLSAAIDHANAMLAGVPANAVLVSRLRKEVKIAKG
jgi:hypothetical protein